MLRERTRFRPPALFFRCSSSQIRAMRDKEMIDVNRTDTQKPPADYFRERASNGDAERRRRAAAGTDRDGRKYAPTNICFLSFLESHAPRCFCAEGTNTSPTTAVIGNSAPVSQIPWLSEIRRIRHKINNRVAGNP